MGIECRVILVLTFVAIFISTVITTGAMLHLSQTLPG